MILGGEVLVGDGAVFCFVGGILVSTCDRIFFCVAGVEIVK